jgi:hypothetical protein
MPVNIFDALAVTLAAAGLSTPPLSALAGRGARAGLSMLMELWAAAGLLRLCGDPSWLAISSALALVVARELVVSRERGLRRTSASELS